MGGGRRPAGCGDIFDTVPSDATACFRRRVGLPRGPDIVAGLLSQPREARSFRRGSGFACAFFVNLLWVRFTGFSLIYPLVSLPLIGIVVLWKVHRRISGPRLELEHDTEKAIIYKEIIRSMDKSVLLNLPLADRILWLCLTLGIVVLLLFHVIRWT